MAVRGHEKLESEGLFTLKKTPGPGMCPVAGCRNKSRTGRNKCLGLCHRHQQYRWRMKDTKRSAYTALRDHAKARKIPFTIDYSYFKGMVDMIAAWGARPENRGQQLSIDRISAERGYEEANLQIVTHSENARKSHREKHLPAVVQALIARKRAKVEEKMWKISGRQEGDDDTPF